MKHLQRLLQILEQSAPAYPFNYSVPDVWNCWNYRGPSRTTPAGEVIVNPYQFFAALIREALMPGESCEDGHSLSLSQKRAQSGDWIREASVYSLMVRHSTCWDHTRCGALSDHNLYGLGDGGSFVKTLALIPLLKRLRINTLYLLPISEFSRRDQKGDLGSPYAVRDFTRLDPALKEPMTGDHMSVEEEFQALVEACHAQGIRVMIDIIPRTNAVDSALITEHPDWFYWIRADRAAEYRPPKVPTLGDTVVPRPDMLRHVYESSDVWRHLDLFVPDPRSHSPERWKKVVERYQKQESDLADLVEREFGCQIAPAFSDHINDVQPPWTDVTFFRMYLDHPSAAKPFLGDRGELQPPYILFDSIKADLYPGSQPNEPLWQMLEQVIPHYQRTFGIDGARIDMGHALPPELVTRIIGKAREVDPDFCFVAEELYPNRAEGAKKLGYNLIIGQGFYMQPRVAEFKAHEFYYGAQDIPLPVFASGETHDTPRLAAREGGTVLARMLSLLNLFTPNGVPFLNAGQEFHERQPINTGLDCRPDEAYRLPEDDPAYGKLALFDRVALHYQEKRRWEMIDLLTRGAEIREQYQDSLTLSRRFVGLGFESMRTPAIGLGYMLDDCIGECPVGCLIIVANTDLTSPQELFVDILALRVKSNNCQTTPEVLLSTHRDASQPWCDERGQIHGSWLPGEVKILRL